MKTIEELINSIEAELILGYVTGEACQSATKVCQFVVQLIKRSPIKQIEVFSQESGGSLVVLRAERIGRIEILIAADGRTYDLIAIDEQLKLVKSTRGHSVDELSHIAEAIESLNMVLMRGGG